MKLVKRYELKCNFGECNERIEKYLNRVLEKSNTYFAFQFQRRELLDLKHEYESMLYFISDIERYLFFYVNNPNFYYILKAIENVEAISVLSKFQRGTYGQLIKDENVVLINPDLLKNDDLDSRERTMMYVAHELGHFVNAQWMSTIEKLIEKCVREGKMDNKEAGLFRAGFALIDEVTTQNRAEEFAYTLAKKPRPQMRYFTNSNMFDGVQFKSNLDYVGELQEPAIMFARALNRISKIEDDDRALHEFSNEATNPNFASRIIREFRDSGRMSNARQMIMNMGIIKKALYCSLGTDKDFWTVNYSKSALDLLRQFAAKMRVHNDSSDAPDEAMNR